MTLATMFDSQHQHDGYGHDLESRRPRFWSGKDTLPRELQYLQPLNAADPQMTRIMVGPRVTININDSADQSLAASTVTQVNYSANTPVPAAWTTPPAGVGVVCETIRGSILATDNSAKLQVVGGLNLSCGPVATTELAPFPTPIPFSFPAMVNSQFRLQAHIPCMIYLPSDGLWPAGPGFSMVLSNTDAAAPHIYRRYLYATYRLVYDIDSTKERVYVMGTLT
jgi:hypothetical protein